MIRDAMWAAAMRFVGWRYGLWSPQQQLVECSGLVGDTVARCYELAHGPDPRSDWWQAVNVWDDARPWSLLDALGTSPGGHVVRARSGPEQPSAGRWHGVQAWRQLTGPDGTVNRSVDRGHQVLWLASDDDPWRGWSLESRPGDGPCVGTAGGFVALDDAIDDAGAPRSGLEAMLWASRFGRYPMVGWVELPPTPPTREA